MGRVADARSAYRMPSQSFAPINAVTICHASASAKACHISRAGGTFPKHKSATKSAATTVAGLLRPAGEETAGQAWNIATGYEFRYATFDDRPGADSPRYF